MSIEIISIGNLLVEIMRKELDKPFHEAADLTGPYPSGDCAIFIDVAARLGAKAGMIGSVGDDAFGDCIRNRFERDGVDTSLISVKPGMTTGCAFVAYFGDGSRQFIFHWRHAAAGDINASDIDPSKLNDVKWAHITGCNIAVNESCKNAVYRLLELLPPSAKVSFDPNIRPEVLNVEQIRALCAPAFERCDIFFPSVSEAMMFTGASSDEEGCKTLAAQGKLVVQKRGDLGCVIYTGSKSIDIPAFKVEEVDPTGAGDSFCAAFVVALMEGKSLREAGLFANAVGAWSTTKKGPMEGAPSREDIEAFLALNRAFDEYN